MEITAVIKALDYLKETSRNYDSIQVYSDSQYVIDLPKRREKLLAQRFLTKKGTPVQNSDLVKTLLAYLEELPVEFNKVKAHQKESESKNYNREVDKLVRKLLRENTD